jgi:uncharacterized membrane protein YgcG
LELLSALKAEEEWRASLDEATMTPPVPVRLTERVCRVEFREITKVFLFQERVYAKIADYYTGAKVQSLLGPIREHTVRLSITLYARIMAFYFSKYWTFFPDVEPPPVTLDSMLRAFHDQRGDLGRDPPGWQVPVGSFPSLASALIKPKIPSQVKSNKNPAAAASSTASAAASSSAFAAASSTASSTALAAVTTTASAAALAAAFAAAKASKGYGHAGPAGGGSGSGGGSGRGSGGSGLGSLAAAEAAAEAAAAAVAAVMASGDGELKPLTEDTEV